MILLRIIAIFSLITGLLFVHTPNLSAQDFWGRVLSKSGTLRTEMRKKHINDSELLVIKNRRGIYSDTIKATIDHNPYINTYREYKATINSSFGPSLSRHEKQALAKHVVDAFLKPIQENDHVIKFRRQDSYARSSRIGETAQIVYTDPKYGSQAAQIRVSYQGPTQILQTAIFPINELEDAKLQQFFNTMHYRPGWAKINNTIKESWNTYHSPHKVFSIDIPPKTKAFRPADLQLIESDNASVGRYYFRDPVRLQNIYYNAYEYIYHDTLTFEIVEKIIKKRHIKRYGREPSVVPIEKQIHRNTPLLYAQFTIPRAAKAPYLNTVMLRVFFDEHTIFVQEIMGSDLLLDTDFVRSLLEHYKFHPEEATESIKKVVGTDKFDASLNIGIDEIVDSQDRAIADMNAEAADMFGRVEDIHSESNFKSFLKERFQDPSEPPALPPGAFFE